jgi:molybdate transport repressor ModE-like protein
VTGAGLPDPRSGVHAMLDVRRLVLLREVRLRGSITGAARALSYTRSAVSQQLAVLEREAGAPLLERVGRGVRLTRAGEELVQHAETIVAVLERAAAGLAARGTEVRGTVRLAAFTTISRTTVPAVVRDLQQRHPGLDVRFRQVEPEEGLLLLSSRRLDVLVADSYPGSAGAPAPDLHAQVLAVDPVRVYLPPGVPDDDPAALSRVRWVLEPSGSEAHGWVRGLCRQHGVEPDVAYESPDLFLHLEMVRQGLAAAVLPDLLLTWAGARLTASGVLGAQRSRRISLVCRAGAEGHPSVAACREAFVRQLPAGADRRDA